MPASRRWSALLWTTFLALSTSSGLVTLLAHPQATREAAALPGDRTRGEEIFRHGVKDSPPCITCHQVTVGGFSFAVGPNLVGIGKRAGDEIKGMTAEQYIEDSILHPSHHLVPGYRDLMYPDFAKHFSPQDIADLIAFLKSL
jgi:mono/diheme cytochrome c family protein